eukprot:9501303-Pyramimonas_sp.AAC.3
MHFWRSPTEIKGFGWCRVCGAAEAESPSAIGSAIDHLPAAIERLKPRYDTQESQSARNHHF